MFRLSAPEAAALLALAACDSDPPLPGGSTPPASLTGGEVATGGGVPAAASPATGLGSGGVMVAGDASGAAGGAVDGTTSGGATDPSDPTSLETEMDAAGNGPDLAASSAALEDLKAFLAGTPAALEAIATQPFATTPLTLEDAALAEQVLWAALAERIRNERAAEHASQQITLDGFTLRYETVRLGEAAESGWDLFISMHGGGSTTAAQNDSQWRNQVALADGYNPRNALWVAPRAPTDDWNMWFKDHIDPLFDRLITNFIALEGVHPDRVYLTGYSAGGDGVYALAPRTADRYAGAAMSAGHPNGVSIDNVRNLAFAIHVGGDDSAYDRNKVGQEYIDHLAELQAQDPEGYAHQGMIHPGLPHWMNLEDAVAIPFLQEHTRAMTPRRVVWEQHEVTQARFYWLAVPEAERKRDTRVVASVAGQNIDLSELSGVRQLNVRVHDDLLDMDQAVRVVRAGEEVFVGIVPRTIAVIAATLLEREDPSATYTGQIELMFSAE